MEPHKGHGPSRGWPPISAAFVVPATGAAAGARRAAATVPPLVGSSALMRELRDRIERVAATDFTVLVEGESGTGKELVARQIHSQSRRAKGPFVAVNCAALVETLVEAEMFGIEDRTATGVRGRRGKFELCEGGTMFLDEISDLSLSAQAKLLRAIQDLSVERVGGHGARKVDIRVVAATNRSLADCVRRGFFRQDLYYRLCGVEVRVPALRRRREDLEELSAHFLSRHRAVRRLTLSHGALEALHLHCWPGNVRELERAIESAVAWARGDVIEVDDLPVSVRGNYTEIVLPSLDKGDTLRAWASRYVRVVFDRCQHNKRRTCEVLDISYHTLQSHLRHNPDRDDASSAADDQHGWSRVDEGAESVAADGASAEASGTDLVEGEPGAQSRLRPASVVAQPGVPQP